MSSNPGPTSQDPGTTPGDPCVKPGDPGAGPHDPRDPGDAPHRSGPAGDPGRGRAAERGAGRLLLAVPGGVSATYVVAAPEWMPADPAGEIAGSLAGLPFPGGREPLAITVMEAAHGHPALAWAQEVFCCPDCSPGAERLLGSLLRRSQRHLLVTCAAPPGWPPLHLYAAARAVDALAELTGGIRLDAEAPRLLPVPWRPEPAAGPESFAAAEWTWIGITPHPGGYVLQSTGLARLGLPELRAEGIPPGHVGAWARLLKALAHVLARRLFAHLAAAPPGPTDLPLPVEPTVTTADAAAAESVPPPKTPREITVRVRHDPATPRVPVAHLTVTPGEGDPVTWCEKG